MTSYARHISTTATPQTEPILGQEQRQVPNSAGGYVYATDDWVRLTRFLVLGSEGGTYYVSEHKLTRDNAAAVIRCIATDGPRTVATIVEISRAGRAPKNDPAIFALALCAKLGDLPTRRAALEAVPEVCRTGTHLFAFAESVQAVGGWGRATKRAVGQWYLRDVKEVAFQAIKYQQRNGWTHRDMLRLAHPQPVTDEHRGLLRWITHDHDRSAIPDGAAYSDLLTGFETLQTTTSAQEAARLITDYHLPREVVPTELLTHADVWAALLPHMPMTAMIRNLATMTRVGLLAPMSEATRHIVSELGNAERLRASRVHPMALLIALKTYAAGHGLKGCQSWTPVSQVIDALDSAFYAAFGNVTPTGKRIILALDVSGSMGTLIGGIAGLSCREASAAMALVTAATEKDYTIMGFSTTFIPLSISPRQRLDDAVKAISGLPFAGTDCSLPMLWALENKVPADAFCVYTDSETWAGKIHPAQALRQYRARLGIAAKEVVVGMTATNFTIADPDDAGTLDVCGFDTAVPTVIADFIGGSLAVEQAS